MGFGEDPRCQNEKSSDEMGGGLVHNAKATEKCGKLHNATIYVNICNLSTLGDVSKQTEMQISCITVYIKITIKACRKLNKC